MSIPSRLKDELPGTFFVTANVLNKQFLLQSQRSANLFIEVLLAYRDAGKFKVHEFTVMPNHIHLLITPADKVSDAMQLIKGGYSFRAGKTSEEKARSGSVDLASIAFVTRQITRIIETTFGRTR